MFQELPFTGGTMVPPIGLEQGALSQGEVGQDLTGGEFGASRSHGSEVWSGRQVDRHVSK